MQFDAHEESARLFSGSLRRLTFSLKFSSCFESGDHRKSDGTRERPYASRGDDGVLRLLERDERVFREERTKFREERGSGVMGEECASRRHSVRL